METGTFKGYETSLSDPGILWIRFNRPERKNGMTSVMKRELIETLTQAQMDDEVRVLVFVGSGDSFCAGDDLKGYTSAMRENDDGLVPLIPPGHDNAIGTYACPFAQLRPVRDDCGRMNIRITHESAPTIIAVISASAITVPLTFALAS